MRIPDDHATCNVAVEEKSSDSVLSFWKEMLTLRKEREDQLVCLSHLSAVNILNRQIYGSFELLSPDDERVFAYYRADRTILVILNFSEEVVDYKSPVDLSSATVIKSTEYGAVEANDGQVQIRPYSGSIWVL